jgi:hypothetical protein
LHVIRGPGRALRIASTLCKHGEIVSAHKAVLGGDTITEFASLMATDVSNLDVFVPL